jgi:hypothetical protein
MSKLSADAETADFTKPTRRASAQSQLFAGPVCRRHPEGTTSSGPQESPKTRVRPGRARDSTTASACVCADAGGLLVDISGWGRLCHNWAGRGCRRLRRPLNKRAYSEPRDWRFPANNGAVACAKLFPPSNSEPAAMDTTGAYPRSAGCQGDWPRYRINCGTACSNARRCAPRIALA